MIQKKKLNQFYIEQYERAGRKKPKKPVKEAGTYLEDSKDFKERPPRSDQHSYLGGAAPPAEEHGLLRLSQK